MKNLTKSTLISFITLLIFVGCGEDGVTTSFTDDASLESALKIPNSTILEAINVARAERRNCYDGRGVVGPSSALTWSSELYASAYEHSSDLAKSDTFSHIGSGTKTDVTGSNIGRASKFNERIRANGYIGYSIIGENIAGGQSSIESALKAWLESPAHCRNIMEAEFLEIGVAVFVNPDSKYGIYWTQNFGSKQFN